MDGKSVHENEPSTIYLKLGDLDPCYLVSGYYDGDLALPELENPPDLPELFTDSSEPLKPYPTPPNAPDSSQ
jgi:hypothetical protein